MIFSNSVLADTSLLPVSTVLPSVSADYAFTNINMYYNTNTERQSSYSNSVKKTQNSMSKTQNSVTDDVNNSVSNCVSGNSSKSSKGLNSKTGTNNKAINSSVTNTNIIGNQNVNNMNILTPNNKQNASEKKKNAKKVEAIIASNHSNSQVSKSVDNNLTASTKKKGKLQQEIHFSGSAFLNSPDPSKLPIPMFDDMDQKTVQMNTDVNTKITPTKVNLKQLFSQSVK